MKPVIILAAFLFFTSSAFSQILNSNFELGRNSGWLEESRGGYTLIGTGFFFASTSIDSPVIPRSGDWMARIGGYSYEVNAIGQSVQLPNTTPLYLSFYVQTRSANTSECAGPYSGAEVSIIINNFKVYSAILCQYNDAMEWTQAFIDMSQLAGQTAMIVFRADAANSVWSYLYLDDFSLVNSTTSADDAPLKMVYSLEQNYPNPFNPVTNISFTLPVRTYTRITVYDNLGREVELLLSEELDAGNYTREWDASGVPSGVYYYRMHAGTYVETKKLILLK